MSRCYAINCSVFSPFPPKEYRLETALIIGGDCFVLFSFDLIFKPAYLNNSRCIKAHLTLREI